MNLQSTHSMHSLSTLVRSLLLVTTAAGMVSCSTASKQDPTAASGPTVAVSPSPQPRQLPIVWQVTEGLSAPESVYFDLRTSLIFVSNIVGDPTSRDGNGYISKLSMDGKMIQTAWIGGLNAPKGLRSYRNKLYVTDIDEIVQIDIARSKVDWKIKIEDAVFLNDLAVSNSGVLYFSDMMTSRIYALPTQGDQARQLSILKSGNEVESPNGLLFVGNSLVVAAWGEGTQNDFTSDKKGRLFRISLSDRSKTLITPEEVGHLDGLESDRNGGYLVSDWMAGTVMRITSKGKIDVLLSGLSNPADIGYFARKRLLLVPEMSAGRVTAYQLP